MTLILNTEFTSGSLGTTAIFKDITGTTAPDSYGKGGNIVYSDIDAIRLKTSTLSSINNVQELSAGDAFTLYVEYLCTAGTSTIDGKSISSGTYFVPSTSGLVVPSNMTFETTGYYVYPFLNSWLPTANQTALTISLAQLNQSSNSTMEDSLYTLWYEVYTDVFNSTQAAVNTKQYMVLSGTCTYNGSTYRAGEVFTATDTTSITISSGQVVIMDSAATVYSVVTYNMIKDIFELLPIADAQVSQEIYEIRVQLESLSFSSNSGNVSYTYTEGLLDTLQKKVTYLLNNN